MKRLFLLPAMGLLLLTSACASIVEGTTQTVTVRTDPSGATCDLLRNGASVAVVNPTPGSVVLDKSRDNVSVECRKEGHQRAAGSLESGFQGMTFGNILFGGIIGVAVDASSGAMHKYPASVHVVLPPEQFGSEQDRDAWFARQADDIEREVAEARRRLEQECRSRTEPQQIEQCKTAAEVIEREREARLDANEAQRLASQIRT